MTLKRTVTLGAACGAIAVWLAAAAISMPPADKQILSYTATPIERRGADLALEVARLRERLRPTATPLQRRDLFRYRHRDGEPRTAAVLPVPPPATLIGDADPATPTFTLVGLAEDAGIDGPVRTAIISGGGDLFMVKEGDAVTSRYQVARISADVVELTDTGAGTSLRLALR